MTKRNRYSNEFKARVALDAIHDEKRLLRRQRQLAKVKLLIIDERKRPASLPCRTWRVFDSVHHG